MNLLTIEIIDNKAIRLIKDLEALNIIKIVKLSKSKDKAKLSSLLSGSITKNQAEVLHNELNDIRKGWNRDTY